MDCSLITPQLVAYDEGQLTQPENERVRAHLEQCPSCRSALGRERTLTAFLTGAQPADVKPNGRRGMQPSVPPTVPPTVHRTDSPHHARGERRHRGIACALAGILLGTFLLPSDAPAYGSIVSAELSPLGRAAANIWTQADEDPLKAANHIQIPAGVSADLNVQGTGTIRAIGPVSFELDFVDGRWKTTVHNGRLEIHVIEGASLLVARSEGPRVLGSGDHVVNGGASSEAVAALLQQGLGAFNSLDFEVAAEELLKAAYHDGADPAQKAQALFYGAAAQANLDRHADVIRTVDAWLAATDDGARGRLTAQFWKAESLAEIGRIDEGRALLEALTAKAPDHPYAPGTRRRIDELADPNRPEPPPKAPAQAPPEQPSPTAARKRTPPTHSSVLWSFPLTAPTFGSAAAADIDGDGRDEIAFGTYFGDRHLYVLKAEDGALEWKALTKSGPRDASVLIYDVDVDGKLEVLSADSATGLLECFDGAGELKWQTKLPSGTDSPAAAADMDGDGDVEIAIGTMKVYADGKDNAQGRLCVLDGKTGAHVWSVKIPGHIQSEPTLVDLNGDGTLDVLVNTWMGDGRLRALDGRDGESLWNFETADWIYHGTSVDDLDGDGLPEVVVADRRGNVWLLQGESGELGWKASLKGEAEGTVFGPTTLVDADGAGALEIVVVGHGVHMLSAAGDVLWERSLGGQSIARGVAVGDVTGDGAAELVLGSGTRLIGLTPANGSEVFSVDLRTGDDPREDIESAPLIFDAVGDERLEVFVVIGRGLYQGMESNYGHAVLVGTEGRGTPEWRTFRGGPLRRGLVSTR